GSVAGAIAAADQPVWGRWPRVGGQAAFARGGARRLEARPVAEPHARLPSLTAGERDVLALVITGRPNKQLADQLQLSEATVKVHRSQIMRKMQAKSLVDLVRMADRLGISADKS